MKTCSKCKVEQVLTEFHKKRDSPDGHRPQCKSCRSEEKKRRYRDDPEFKAAHERGNREGAYKRKFGINTETYENMLEACNNVCQICNKPETRSSRGRKAEPMRLAVDHCHTTGKVRGLLCQACNTALGQFNDDTDLLTKAINYLKERQ